LQPSITSTIYLHCLHKFILFLLVVVWNLRICSVKECVVCSIHLWSSCYTLFKTYTFLYLSSSQMYELKLQQNCNLERWTSLEIPSSVTDTIQGRFRFEIISTLFSFELSNMWWFIRCKGKPNAQSVVPSMPESLQYGTKFLEPS
jgi:hypothetical protein